MIAALLLGGCASHAVRMGATPLPPGARSTTVALDAVIFERGREYFALPNPELAVRWGLDEQSDAGGRANLFGADASYRRLATSGSGWALAWTAGGGLGWEPITNNSTDLIYARATGRLIGELGVGREVDAIAFLSPSLAFTGPLTMFRGVFDSSRFVARPGAGLGLARRAISIEVGIEPAFALDGSGWLTPSVHLGAGWRL